MAQQIKKKFIDGVVFTEIDGKISQSLLDAKGYADSQDAAKLLEAKGYADAAVLVEKTRAEGAEAQVLVDAKAYADVKKGEAIVAAESYADLKKSEAITDAHAYADQVKNDLLGGAGPAYDTLKKLEVALQNEDSAIVALTNTVGADLVEAKAYADAAVLVEKTRAEGVEVLKADITYVDSQDAAKLVEAKAYTDSKIAAIPAVDLTPYLKADGTVPMSGSLNVGNFQIVNLPQAQEAGQAVEYSQFADRMGNAELGISSLQAIAWGSFKKVIAEGETLSFTYPASFVPGSVILAIDGIMMLEFEDFEVIQGFDGNGNVLATINFLGSLVSGPQAVEVGDVVYMKYQVH